MWQCEDCGQEFEKKSGPHIRKHKGVYVPWNKGLTKEEDQRIAHMGQMNSEYRKGVPTGRKGKSWGNHSEESKKKIGEAAKYTKKWNKGLTKESDERVKKQSELMKTDAYRQKTIAANKEWAKNNPEKSKERARAGGKATKGVLKVITEAVIEGWKRAGEKNKQYKRELASNWQGGKSFEEYGLEWTSELREDIRKRDDFTCQVCGIKQEELYGYLKRLDVHHISFNKTDCSQDNLIALCRSCHQKEHSRMHEEMFVYEVAV